MKTIKIIIILFMGLIITACNQTNQPKVKIGIIEPLEHRAMNEIVAGFSDTIKKLYPNNPVQIEVENAENDPNLERVIVEKMRASNYTIILPIGVGATEMTLATIHHQAVISLASDLSETDRQKLSPCNVAVVHDEISSKQLLQFIHTAYPQIKELTLVHSSADKVLPEVEETIAIGKQFGITIHHKMVSSLPELITVANALPANTQGILVLKDSLIVSGISILNKAAKLHHVPLITSDEGSVQDGAGLALGVHEREIGVAGANLAAQVLNGKAICHLPIVGMKNLTVFVNQKVLLEESQTLLPIQTSAHKLNYNLELVDL